MSAPKITLAFVGDVMLTRPLDMLKSPDRAAHIKRLTETADFAIANLEMALPKSSAPADKLSTIGSDPELVGQIAECGFQAVTLANNHVMDHGPSGLLDTLAAVDCAGVLRAGAGRDFDEAVMPLRLQTASGHHVNIVNFACTIPPGAAAGQGRPGIAPLRVTEHYRIDPIFSQEQPGTSPWVEARVESQDLRAARDAIAKAGVAGGPVIAIIHWGVPPYWHAPFQGTLATYQRPLAQALVRAGAWAIVGHHPHVLHGIEVIDGCPVFYSLGNFIWHPRKIDEPDGEIPLSQPAYREHWLAARKVSAVDPRKRESAFVLVEWRGRKWSARIIPMILGDNGEPEPLPLKSGLRILRSLAGMSGELGCGLDIGGGEAVLSGEVRR